MKSKDFINATVLDLSESGFEKLKQILISKYIFFTFVEEEQVDKNVFGEKLLGWFECVFKSSSDTFEKEIHQYIRFIDSLVYSRINKPSKKVSDSSRAWKYYNKVSIYNNDKKPNLDKLFEYSRVAFLLYMSILENNGQEISTFNFNLSSLDVTKIILSFENRELEFSQKLKSFVQQNALHNRKDVVTVLTVLILNKLMDEYSRGDYYYE